MLRSDNTRSETGKRRCTRLRRPILQTSGLRDDRVVRTWPMKDRLFVDVPGPPSCQVFEWHCRLGSALQRLPLIFIRTRSPLATHNLFAATFFHSHINPEPMDTNAPQPKRRDNVLTSLNVAIDVVNIAKDALSMTPAKAACYSVSVILTMIKVGFLPLHTSTG